MVDNEYMKYEQIGLDGEKVDAFDISTKFRFIKTATLYMTYGFITLFLVTVASLYLNWHRCFGTRRKASPLKLNREGDIELHTSVEMIRLDDD